jgi:hypothetical protein
LAAQQVLYATLAERRIGAPPLRDTRTKKQRRLDAFRAHQEALQQPMDLSI